MLPAWLLGPFAACCWGCQRVVLLLLGSWGCGWFHWGLSHGLCCAACAVGGGKVICMCVLLSAQGQRNLTKHHGCCKYVDEAGGCLGSGGKRVHRLLAEVGLGTGYAGKLAGTTCSRGQPRTASRCSYLCYLGPKLERIVLSRLHSCYWPQQLCLGNSNVDGM